MALKLHTKQAGKQLRLLKKLTPLKRKDGSCLGKMREEDQDFKTSPCCIAKLRQSELYEILAQKAKQNIQRTLVLCTGTGVKVP